MFNFIDKWVDGYIDKKKEETAYIIDAEFNDFIAECRSSLKSQREAYYDRANTEFGRISERITNLVNNHETQIKTRQDGLSNMVEEQLLRLNDGELAKEMMREIVKSRVVSINPKMVGKEFKVEDHFELIRYASFTDKFTGHYKTKDSANAREMARKNALNKALEAGCQLFAEVMQEQEFTDRCLMTGKKGQRYQIDTECTVNVAYFKLNKELETEKLHKEARTRTTLENPLTSGLDLIMAPDLLSLEGE